MTLQQKLAEMIGQWHGLDATERSARQAELVDHVINLVQTERPGRNTTPPQAQKPAA